MADKSDAEKLFDAVASGSAVEPVRRPENADVPPPAAPAEQPKAFNAKALFDEVAKTVPIAVEMTKGKKVAPPPEPGSAAEGRLIMERSGDPRFAMPPEPAHEPPTMLQQAISPLARGASAVFNDLPNLIVGGAMSAIPAGIDLATGDRSFSRFKNSWGAEYLRNTGDQSPILTGAAKMGLIPSDPSWRPDHWLARALYNTSDLATQIGLTAGLGGFATAARTAAPVKETVQKAFAQAPVRDYVAAPTLGGATGTAAHKFAPEGHEEGAEGVGMAVGSMAPYLMVPNIIKRGAQAAYDFFKAPKPADTGRVLAEQIGADPRVLLEQHSRARELAPTIDGWTPTPGTVMAGNVAPGERDFGTALLGMERRQADKPAVIPGEGITPTEFRQRNTQALQDELRTGIPPEGLPAAAAREVQPRIDQVREIAARRAQQLEGNAAALEAGEQQAQEVVNAQLPRIAPGERTQARSEASRRVFGAMENTEDRLTMTGSNLFETVDPEKTARVPLYRIRDALDEVKRVAVESGRTDAIPKIMIKPKDEEGRILGDKIDDYLHNWEQEVPNPQFLANVPYERIKGLRTRLTTAQRQATDPQERKFLGTLIKGVDQAVAESNSGQLAQRYGEARDFWRENVALPFREGVVAGLLRKDKEFTAASTLFAPGERGAQNMRQIAAQVRSDPDFYRSVVDYARADMTAFATDVNGRVNSRKLKEWVDKHAPVLGHFPELRQEFDRIATAQRTADAYIEDVANRVPALRALADRGVRNTEDAIRNSAARFYLNAAPEDVVSRVLGVKGVAARRQAAEQTMAMLKTREGREGLARSYYDYIVKRALGGEERVDPKGGWKSSFSKILDQEKDVADVWLPEQVRARMRALDKAISMESKRDAARANAGARTAEDTGSADAANLSVGHRLVQSLRGDLPTVMGGASTGALAGIPMGGTASTIGAVVGGASSFLGRHAMVARTAAKEAALREAIFNGDVFEEVMSRASLDAATKKRIGNAIRPYVIIANTEALADADQ